MAFDRAFTSLQFVEDKLRNFFGLAGRIDTKFTPEVTPALVVGDLRDPGVASFRGRWWSWASDDNLGGVVGQGIGLTFPAPVIVRGYGMVAGAPARFVVTYNSPDTTLPFPTARGAGTWVDQKTRRLDQPPLQDSGPNFVARVGAPDTNPVTGIIVQLVENAIWRPTPLLHFPAGAQLGFEAVSGNPPAGARVWAFGQIA